MIEAGNTHSPGTVSPYRGQSRPADSGAMSLSTLPEHASATLRLHGPVLDVVVPVYNEEIGRASCRERVFSSV